MFEYLLVPSTILLLSIKLMLESSVIILLTLSIHEDKQNGSSSGEGGFRYSREYELGRDKLSGNKNMGA